MKILVNNQDWGQNEQRRIEDTYGGVGYYRLWKPYQQIKGHDKEFIGQNIKKYGKNYAERWDNIFKDIDVYWTSYFVEERTAAAMFNFRDKHKKKVIIDVDDNYLDILPSNPLYDKFKPTKKNRAILGATLSFADAITVSTEPLKQRLLRHFKEVYGLDKKIFVLPNFNDVNDWNHVPEKQDKFIIGYSGSNSHQDDLRMVMPVVDKIMRKYKHVHLEVIGSIDKQALNIFNDFDPKCLDRCDILSGTWTFNEYPKYLASRGFDIGLAPLVDSAFTRSKSHIKWMEYSMYKIPTIASEVYPYYMPLWERETIEHDTTGLLVKPSEWFDAIENLVLDGKKRKELGENAYKYVKNNWQYESSGMDEKIDFMLKNI